ncbi:RNA-binding protein 2-like [Mangifera indica]|uniref:RNA-binding protein 2-like n=1 Tax=Mangifera indica TaxID=29780 RepID=UPI001CFA21FE|nr:RNA-binding protein 2-like [Mangifera indica]XP_044510997.1 RNA-binding protein 2-like [Mangifera indica]
MAEGYWNRQQASLIPSGPILKRPRSDYDLPQSGMSSHHEMHSYLSRDDDHGEPRSINDTRTIGSAYDRYLQSAQYPSFPSGEASALGVRSGRALSGGLGSISVVDSGVTGHPGAIGRDMVSNGRSRNLDDGLSVETMTRLGHETLPLPPDASNTLYVEGFPPDTTRREVAHIFRPFVGYKEVRLVSKGSKQRGGDPLILCFVDFASPACAATAMSALQGYKMDEDDPDSRYLRLQFSRYPGQRSGSGTRGRR